MHDSIDNKIRILDKKYKYVRVKNRTSLMYNY